MRRDGRVSPLALTRDATGLNSLRGTYVAPAPGRASVPSPHGRTRLNLGRERRTCFCLEPIPAFLSYSRVITRIPHLGPSSRPFISQIMLSGRPTVGPWHCTTGSFRSEKTPAPLLVGVCFVPAIVVVLFWQCICSRFSMYLSEERWYLGMNMRSSCCHNTSHSHRRRSWICTCR